MKTSLYFHWSVEQGRNKSSQCSLSGPCVFRVGRSNGKRIFQCINGWLYIRWIEQYLSHYTVAKWPNNIKILGLARTTHTIISSTESGSRFQKISLICNWQTRLSSVYLRDSYVRCTSHVALCVCVHVCCTSYEEWASLVADQFHGLSHYGDAPITAIIKPSFGPN